jgi:tRNA threonylcarbamoyladenosine biosynthesis protein TsaE
MMLQSNSASETKAIGQRIGSQLKAGNVVCLYGDLGAGKTTITQGIASSLGINERDITSASFTIISEHEGTVPFYHIDLYRLHKGEASGLALHEYFKSEGISVIEWAERAEDEIPEGCIKVTMTHTGDDTRDVEIEGMTV